MLSEFIDPLVRSRTIWLASASVFLAAACGVTGPGSSAVTIEMSVTAFTRPPLSQTVFPPFQLSNHDSVTVYVPGCGPHPVLALQQLTSAGWQDIPPLFYCISAPVCAHARCSRCRQSGMHSDRHVALHGFLSPRSEWADAGRDGTAIHGAVAGCRLTSASSWRSVIAL